MSILRTGLLLASLFLSACTMPILNDSSKSKEEDNAIQPLTPDMVDRLPDEAETGIIPNKVVDDTSDQNTMAPIPVIEPSQTVKANKEVTEDTISAEQAQLEDNIQRATSNFVELKQRTGNAPEVPTIFTLQTDTPLNLNDSLQELRSYISKTNTALAVLDARVSERQDMAANGDIIRIFVSEATVDHGQSSFKAQPIVGQWVRGESRIIRLKDNILFENPQSEDLQIAFSETYQLIVNGQVISIVNPNKEKNTADFSVATERNGKINGSLDYRIVESK